MMYAPHILEKKSVSKERDGYGRIFSSSEIWEKVCRCRCDDNDFKEIVTDNGRVYRPQYHIVTQRDVRVSPGEEIRVWDGDRLRAQGKVFDVKSLNYLDYSEIWV